MRLPRFFVAAVVSTFVPCQLGGEVSSREFFAGVKIHVTRFSGVLSDLWG